MTCRVALVTCLEMPEPDADESLMVNILRDGGIDAEIVGWDDQTIDWPSYDLCVLRSTWDYHERANEFLAWIDKVGAVAKLRNPASVVRWNIHKRYLNELESAGLSIVPTEIVMQGSKACLADIVAKRGWDDVVVKPCISAGSANTVRVNSSSVNDGDTFFRTLVSTRDVMIQPYIKSVESGGERAAIMIGGVMTHAIEKSPRFQDDDEQVSSDREITDTERVMMRKALGCVPGEALYARLDTMRSDDNKLLISELEVIEPSLFLLQSQAAQEAFVEAIRNEVASG
jgi:glutathione synthase/RimK-type ligase-like ATP-grasp enzyme